MSEELSGILNWAIEGYKELESFDGFLINDQETRTMWIMNSDNISAFVQNCLVREIDSWIKKEEVYGSYVEFCRKMDSIPKAENAFHRSLISKIEVTSYQPTEDGKQIHAWKGVKFTEKQLW